MSQASQALWSDAVPLLVIAAGYVALAVWAWLSLGIVVGLAVAFLVPAVTSRRRREALQTPPAPDGARASSSDDASSARLAEALERERFIARISARVRSELAVDELLRVAIEETAKELRVQRCFIRLGARGESPTAQWQAEGLEAIHDRDQLAVSNLAVKKRQTVAVGDVETAPELEQSIGARQKLLAIGTRAALAVPIVVFDELIGVLSLHRTTPQRWTDDEIALTEAVAHEIGLSVRVAQLLRENERRLVQQQ
ncbi:MAG TPA: GAF domain-containing protein, partial [Gaiellaceae bacterium]